MRFAITLLATCPLPALCPPMATLLSAQLDGEGGCGGDRQGQSKRILVLILPIVLEVKERQAPLCTRATAEQALPGDFPEVPRPHGT